MRALDAGFRVTTPIEPLPISVNQRLPSGPVVIPQGLLEVLFPLLVETGNSVMAWVAGLISPILPVPCSVNQRLPSGPAVIPVRPALAVGTGNSAMAWV